MQRKYITIKYASDTGDLKFCKYNQLEKGPTVSSG